MISLISRYYTSYWWMCASKADCTYFFRNNALCELRDSSQQWSKLRRSDQETFDDKHVKKIFPSDLLVIKPARWHSKATRPSRNIVKHRNLFMSRACEQVEICHLLTIQWKRHLISFIVCPTGCQDNQNASNCVRVDVVAFVIHRGCPPSQ